MAGGSGHRMMLKMGWKEGEGLGKGNQGITTPLWLDPRSARAGLHSEAGGEQRPKKEKDDAGERFNPARAPKFVAAKRRPEGWQQEARRKASAGQSRADQEQPKQASEAEGDPLGGADTEDPLGLAVADAEDPLGLAE